MSRRAFLIGLAFLFACQGCPPPGEVADPVAPRPTPIPRDTDKCDEAEAHLLALGCPEGRPTKGGTTFSAVCHELQDNGIFVNPACLASIKNCSEVDMCTNTVQPPKPPPN